MLIFIVSICKTKVWIDVGQRDEYRKALKIIEGIYDK